MNSEFAVGQSLPVSALTKIHPYDCSDEKRKQQSCSRNQDVIQNLYRRKQNPQSKITIMYLLTLTQRKLLKAIDLPIQLHQLIFFFWCKLYSRSRLNEKRYKNRHFPVHNEIFKTAKLGWEGILPDRGTVSSAYKRGTSYR